MLSRNCHIILSNYYHGLFILWQIYVTLDIPAITAVVRPSEGFEHEVDHVLIYEAWRVRISLIATHWYFSDLKFTLRDSWQKLVTLLFYSTVDVLQKVF